MTTSKSSPGLKSIDVALADPSSSAWLLKALQEALLRDPVDVANDCEFLSELLNQRAENALRGIN